MIMDFNEKFRVTAILKTKINPVNDARRYKSCSTRHLRMDFAAGRTNEVAGLPRCIKMCINVCTIPGTLALHTHTNKYTHTHTHTHTHTDQYI